MEKKEITVGNPVTVAGLNLIPVSTIKISGWRSKWGTAFSGSKQPVGIIIVTPSANRAFRITGEEITLDKLAREIPDIRETLKAL